MLCNQFQARLDELLDERVCPSTDVELKQHGACCSACDRVLAMHLQLLSAFDDERLDEATVSRPAGWAVPASRWAVLAATACAVMIAAVVLFPRQDAGPSVATTDAIAEVQPVATPVVERHAEQTVAEPMIADLGTENEGGMFVYQPLISIGLLARADWNYDLAPASVPFVGQLPQVDETWRKAVVDGMSPVQASMNTTLNLIARSITSS